MNVYITSYCNQGCPYCFAVDYMSSSDKKEMTFESFKKVLDFLKRSHVGKVKLEGGEPTLHPAFEDFVDFALLRGFEVELFTNGLFGEKLREFLQVRRHHVGYLWNINSPHLYQPKDWEKLRNNLGCLTGGRSSFGVNLYHAGQPLDHVYDLCREFRPASLRYVFAHQMGRLKAAVVAAQDLPKVIAQVVALTRKVAEELGIRSYVDCGFIPCVWSDADLATLIRYGTLYQGCSVCPGVDPDLNVSHCFHVSEPADVAPLESFQDMNAVLEFFDGIKKKYQHLSLFNHCKDCLSKKLGSCDGGCLGDRLAASGAS